MAHPIVRKASLVLKKRYNTLRIWLDLFPHEEKVFVIVLILQTLVFFFFPVLEITSVTSQTTSYVFSFFPHANGLFFYPKLFTVVFLTQCLLRFWHSHPKMRLMMSSVIGFTENPFLVTIALLWVNTILFLSLSDSVAVLGLYTSTVSLTVGYYILLFSYVFSFIYCLYVVLALHKNSLGGRSGIHTAAQSQKPSSSRSMDNLFEKITHDE